MLDAAELDGVLGGVRPDQRVTGGDDKSLRCDQQGRVDTRYCLG